MSANPWLKYRRQALGKAPTGIETLHPGCPSDPAKQASVAPSCAVTAVSIANRQAMPQVAAVVDQLREVFGPVQVVFASERGKALGRELPPGVIAYSPHVPSKSRKRGTP